MNEKEARDLIQERLYVMLAKEETELREKLGKNENFIEKWQRLIAEADDPHWKVEREKKLIEKQKSEAYTQLAIKQMELAKENEKLRAFKKQIASVLPPEFVTQRWPMNVREPIRKIHELVE